MATTTTAGRSPREPRAESHMRPAGRRAAARARERDCLHLELPVLGTVTLPAGDQLAFLGGVGVLAVVGLIEWPVAVVVTAGHLLSASRSHRVLRGFGEALEQA